MEHLLLAVTLSSLMATLERDVLTSHVTFCKHTFQSIPINNLWLFNTT